MVKTSRSHRRSLVLAIWILSCLVLFGVASAVTRAYAAKREALAERWFERGLAALQASQPEAAISDFRDALVYSRSNPQYRLQLAEALLAAGRTQEASDYFESLWQERPSDGRINLALARLQARRRDIPEAIRYYQGAIYGQWDQDRIQHREKAELELVGFLLANNGKAQAQPELLTLAQEEPNDPGVQVKIADLFAQAGDFEDALQESRKVLRLEPENPAALAIAGAAAFHLGRYSTAEDYLRKALERERNNQEAVALLEKVRLIASANPYQRGFTLRERNRRVIEAFTAAGERLQSCAQQRKEPLEVEQPTTELQKLYDQWSDLNPGMNERMLRQQPDLADSAMDLVFRIEERTRALCGPPSGLDEALLLIGENREGTSQ